MARSGWPKVVGLGAILVAVSVGLSGCAVVGNAVDQAAHNRVIAVKDADKPTVGQCWTATSKDLGFADWGIGRNVSCSATHELYTFGVPKLEVGHSGSEYDHSGYEKEALSSDAYTTCTDFQETTLGESQYYSRLNVQPYIPESAQWKAGARWVRCDFYVYAIGSAVNDPALEAMPTAAVIKAELRSDSGLFDFCTNVPGDDLALGPKGPGAVYALCSSEPEWVFNGTVDFPYALGSAYPARSALVAVYEQDCAKPYDNATHITYPIYPTKSQWQNGDESGECWVGRKQ